MTPLPCGTKYIARQPIPMCGLHSSFVGVVLFKWCYLPSTRSFTGRESMRMAALQWGTECTPSVCVYPRFLLSPSRGSLLLSEATFTQSGAAHQAMYGHDALFMDCEERSTVPRR